MKKLCRQEVEEEKGILVRKEFPDLQFSNQFEADDEEDKSILCDIRQNSDSKFPLHAI
jgi:hypothetical protein